MNSPPAVPTLRTLHSYTAQPSPATTHSRSAFTTIGLPPPSTPPSSTSQVSIMRCSYSNLATSSTTEPSTTRPLPKNVGGDRIWSSWTLPSSSHKSIFDPTDPTLPTNKPLPDFQQQKPVLVQVALNATDNTHTTKHIIITTTTNGTERNGTAGNGTSIDFGDDGPLRGVTLGITILSIVTIFLCVVAFVLSTRICWKALERDYSGRGV
jgi:hypothetical protein